MKSYQTSDQVEESSGLRKVDFDYFLEEQFKQISEQIPINFILLVYEDLQHQILQHFYRKNFCLTLNYLVLEDITQICSDIYIDDIDPALQVNFREEYQDYFLYYLPLNQKSLGVEYLAFLSEFLLTDSQEKVIKNYAKTIRDYLNLYQTYLNQNHEIQILESLIHQIGHQLRNPLALISLITENLKLSLPNGQDPKPFLSIQEIINNLNNHLTQLLDCGKRTRLRLEIHDLRDIFLKSLKTLNLMLESKEISLEYPETKEVIVTVDSLQIQQVFSNLLSNAISFSPQGGKIICKWQVFQQEIIVTIADQGQGLSSQDLKNIFTPFYSRRTGGTGLGLTIVKKIIMDHGGSIWAENLPKTGTKFTFTLPRYNTELGK